MKVQVLRLNEEIIRFLIQGVDFAFVNSLRRTMMAEVPIMTIDDLFIFDNSSLVSDEVLAHRIGLLPLTTDLETYVLPENCDCQSDMGCPKCRVALTMDVEAVDENRTVYSGDLIPEDPKIKPVSPNVPIAKLAPGQAIRFEAYAQLGKGKTHAKWSPVSMAVYENVVEFEAPNTNKAKECIEGCPNGVISTGRRKIKIVDQQAFYRCKSCSELLSIEEYRDAIKMDEFVFTVESIGALPPERIIKEAVNILKSKFDELDGKLERGETNEVIIEFEVPSDIGRSLYTFGSGDFDEEEEEGDTDYNEE